MNPGQDKQQFSNIQIWYSEKLGGDYLFCRLDGKELPAREVSALDAQKVRDGILRPEELARRIFHDFLSNPLEAGREVQPPDLQQDRSVEQVAARIIDNADEKLYELVYDMDREIPGTMNTAKRMYGAMKGIVSNLVVAGGQAGRWLSDMTSRFTKGDYRGMRDEARTVAGQAWAGVRDIADSLQLRQRARSAITYADSLISGARHLIGGRTDKAKEAVTPLAEDVGEVLDETLVKTGIVRMAGNAIDRIPEVAGAVKDLAAGQTGQAKETLARVAQQTGDDIKNVIRSDNVRGAVRTVVRGVEEVERATRPAGNRQREDAGHDRLSDITVFPTPGGAQHLIRCKIDGHWQVSRRISQQDWELLQTGSVTRTELAERYYADDLTETVERTRTMTHHMSRQYQ